VELAVGLGPAQPGRLIMAAISAVFTIGIGKDGAPAFTRDGIENLSQIIADERAAGRGPPTTPPK
jgi:hypothetical protein